jgi:Pyruvate/2-oxoacid:ferredoxin oxidoreductase gamma subunit
VKGTNGGMHAFGLPATEIAHRTFGRDVVANVIMLGCLAGLTAVTSVDSLRMAIAESVPSKTVDMNLAAFEEGLKRGAGHRRQREKRHR